MGSGKTLTIKKEVAVGSEVDLKISEHERECEKRYAEISVAIARLEVNSTRNTRLLVAIVIGVVTVAIKSFLFSGGL